MQSAPPLLGSQLSRGSSTHVSPALHFVPANPPHAAPTQIPGQSAPPFIGSQLSLGSSTHFWSDRGHFLPVNPPQEANFGAARTERIEVEPVPPTQILMQSDPPFFGSQSSLGSSMHFWSSLGHLIPAMPPHGGPVGRGRETQIPGQSAPPCFGSQSSLGLSTQT